MSDNLAKNPNKESKAFTTHETNEVLDLLYKVAATTEEAYGYFETSE